MSQHTHSSHLATHHLSNYRIQRELGKNREGGRITYLATHQDGESLVVLKQFRFAQSDANWSGFKSHEREIKILRAINHPQVPCYIDSFETDDGFCLVQEYKKAPSLAERTNFTTHQIKQLSLSILKVLADLQQQSPPIIHRDLKPENILVDEKLQAYLIDFGLAKSNDSKLAVSSVVAGTPGFISPESFFNRPLTMAADLYSVGATIVALLTQTPSTNISDLLDDNYRFNLTNHLPQVSLSFVTWLEKMVAPNPLNRFPDAMTALQALEPIDIAANPSFKVHREVHKTQRPFFSRGAIGLVIIAISAALIPNMLLTAPTAPYSAQLVQSASNTRSPEQNWFETIKPHCNALEVITAIQSNPYPKTPVGVGAGASCYALAGKLDLADRAIASLPTNQQSAAAMVLFEIGHPVADRGDDESAGPIMDLVLKYWPENYMARYHAGMSAYVLADHEKATAHLETFLETYHSNDGWRHKALLALENIQNDIPADERFKFHH